METTATSNRIHPLMAAAAVSLTLVSLVGAIAGLIWNKASGEYFFRIVEDRNCKGILND
jgi:hypothetical protein